LLTLAGTLVLPLLWALLWRGAEPPVLMFAATYQWIQVYMPVLNANLAGLDLGQDASVAQLDYAAYLGLAALVVLALGMRLGRGNRTLDRGGAAFQEVAQLSPARLLCAYLIAQAIGIAAGIAGNALPGLRQPLLALGLFRWALVFIFLWAGLCDSRFRPLAVGVFLVEIGLGFVGYFSGFKSVIFVAIVVALATTRNRQRLLRLPVLALACILIVLGVFWQSIKVEYREFLNKGTLSQTVRVPVGERIDFLERKVTTITTDDLRKGLKSGAERTGYLEYFARATTVVPDRVPYQDGQLWIEALTHIITPRLLFPEKKAIDDSERVRKYSGVWVAGAAEGTSISLGYVAESYVDFGPWWMFVPVYVLGVFWGWTYRVLATTGPHRLLGFGLASSLILMNAILFESSNIKIVGGAVTSLLVGWLVLHFGSDGIWSLLLRKAAAPRGVRGR